MKINSLKAGDEKFNYETALDDNVTSILEYLIPDDELNRLKVENLIDDLRYMITAVILKYTNKVYKPTTFTVNGNHYFTKFPYSMVKALSCDIA